MGHASHTHIHDDVTLKHPDFVRWRANIASMDPNFHARLDQADLLMVFRHRSRDSIREVMDGIRAKHALRTEPLDPKDVDLAKVEAVATFNQTQTEFNQWKAQALGQTRSLGLSTKDIHQQDLLDEFAAREHPHALLEIQARNDLRAVEQQALENYPDIEGFMRWTIALDEKDAGFDLRRHQRLFLTEAIAEYEAQGKDGYARLCAEHDAALAQRAKLTPQERADALRDQAQSLQQQIRDDHLRVADPNDPYIVATKRRSTPQDTHSPSSQVMQNLQINTPADDKTQEQVKQQADEHVSRPGGKLSRIMEQAEQIFSQFNRAVSGFSNQDRERRVAERM